MLQSHSSPLTTPTILALSDSNLTQRIRAVIYGCPSEAQFAEGDRPADESRSSVTCLGPTYVGLRSGGRLRHAYWQYDLDVDQALNAIVNGAIACASGFGSGAGAADKSNDPKGFDTFELCFTYRYRQVDPDQFQATFSNINRGIRGIELQYGDRLVRYSPTRMIAANLSFRKIFEQFLQQESIAEANFIRNGGVIQAFEARQVLVMLTPEVVALTLHRGNRVVPQEHLSGEVLTDLKTQMGQWLLRQVQSDGRMVYKYFPSRGTESDGNNLIRQFMATLALIRYAQATQEPTHWTIAGHNLDYNLRQFYTFGSAKFQTPEFQTAQRSRTQSGGGLDDKWGEASDRYSDIKLGWVEYSGKAKLGAIALAALAILEYSTGMEPVDDRPSHGEASESMLKLAIAPPYKEIFRGLCQTIEHLWQSDGSFRTFLKPIHRNDNQNFYPGEALLFWANLYGYTRDEALLQRCYQSVAYYRSWHLTHFNPAFIPWHSQAYALLYETTGDRQFLDLIFSMNDRLLPLQQWFETDSPQQADIQGRFYAPDADYGPPHASSTGVYLEGLADAYRLATHMQDQDRIQSYGTAIWRGLRSLRQLQFRDRVDLFYVSKRARVQGGLRTTVYDNVIRVDNVQHGLMALLKLQRMAAFQPGAVLPRRLSGMVLSGTKTLSQSTDGVIAPSAVAPAADSLDPRPRTWQHFRLIESQVDIQPLLDELAAQEHLWLRDKSRQTNINVQRETQTIYLRSAVKPFPPGITSSNDVHASRLSAVAPLFPQVLAWVEQFAAAQQGDLGRVTLVRLAPKGRVYRHIDHGAYYQVRDRFHLVLHSSAGSLLKAGDEWVRMQPGECWWFDNKQPHEAANESDDWRVHLIFDLNRQQQETLVRSGSVST